MFESLIKGIVQDAFKTVGDLAPKHTYVATNAEDSVYDPATGTMNEVSLLYDDVPMVLARFKIDEMDNQIIPTTDLKVLIAANDLPVDPTVQDLIYLDGDVTYMVERVMGVPGESLHILHVRQTQRPS